MKLVWIPPALDDLEQLRAYIATDAPAAGEMIAARVVRAVLTLADFPQRGRPGRVRGTRELVVPSTPYVVAYRVEADDVEVLRIVHGARRWPAL
jgi:toxin ParE1/3/4